MNIKFTLTPVGVSILFLSSPPPLAGAGGRDPLPQGEGDLPVRVKGFLHLPWLRLAPLPLPQGEGGEGLRVRDQQAG